MNKNIIISATVIVMLLVAACESRSAKAGKRTQNPVGYTKQDNHKIKKITLFEEESRANRLYILKIDSIEYLVNHNGGIIKLPSNK